MEDWRRTGGGLEEDWRRTGGGLEEAWFMDPHGTDVVPRQQLLPNVVSCHVPLTVHANHQRE